MNQFNNVYVGATVIAVIGDSDRSDCPQTP